MITKQEQKEKLAKIYIFKCWKTLKIYLAISGWIHICIYVHMCAYICTYIFILFYTFKCVVK